jgi:hypothetical protein
MPTTPVKRTSTKLFGLLTPCTPNFSGFAERGHEIGEEEDSKTDEPPRTKFDELQQQIKEAELAAILAQEGIINGQRRSTRIAKQDTVKGNFSLVPKSISR